MRHPASPQAIGTFGIPPHPPPEVEEAYAEYNSIAARWADTTGALQDAVEQLEKAKVADLQHIVDMAKQDKQVKDPQAKARKVEDLIADLRVRLKGLDMAVDQAGNRLAETIAEHRREWLPRLAEAEIDAATRFDEAVAAARAALSDLHPARGAVDWLNRFDADLARSGQSTQFTGGRLRVRSRAGLLKGEHDPTDPEDRPSVQRMTEPRYLTGDELGRLLGCMSNTFRPIAASCALAGLRVSEALGLTWGDVDFEGKTITVSKQLGTDGERVPTKTPASRAAVPLLPALERELRAHRSRQASRDLRFTHRDALVFSTTRGKPQSRRNVLRAVQLAGDEVGLNGEGREVVGVHDLRHSFVAIALANGVTLPEAAMLARHANPRVTLAVYAGLTDGAREVAVDKLLSAGFGA